MDNFEETLRNIDVFCKILVNKMLEGGNECESYAVVEPMEKLLRRKYIIEERIETNPKVKGFIPLPHIEEPLIDVFEEDSQIKVLMHCRCRDHGVTIRRQEDSLQICLENECWRLNLPVDQLHVENVTVKCNNNEALEVDIPKTKV